MTHRARVALYTRVTEGCVRIGALMLEPTEENIAQAMMLSASVLQDIVRIGGRRCVERSQAMLAQLVEEGVLAP